MAEKLGDPSVHFFMTRSVARVMGFNLYEEVQSGALSAADYSEMVTRCRGCALVEACQEWLSTQTNLSTNPPPGCCNGEQLCALRKTQRAH
ncbi:DUF6455 family protein [Pacificoceanicola onchidii]|uniref:DUF6455 family protein n=1 Tax=Pacificoceanicola onchidii TaxID=2562685 RepID=UPI0010A4035F|nr:DUF6455 family protein [Pacificoceanicola onchidii]